MKRFIVPVTLLILTIASNPILTRAQLGVVGPPQSHPATPHLKGPSTAPDTLWTARFGDFDNQWPYAGDDKPAAILPDGSGGVYVTGEGGYPPGSTYLNFTTIRYDSLGDTLWVRSFYNPNNNQSNDKPSSMALGTSGEVYVAGTMYYNTGWDRHDMGVVAYDDAGNELWHDAYSGPYSYMALASDVDEDGSGHVYVGGQFSEAYAWHAGLVQYGALGTRNWVISETSDQNRIFNDIACDGSGNVYCAGYGWGGGHGKGSLIKYDADGNKLWENHYNPQWQDASFNDLALDPNGNVCVTGWRESPVSGDNNLAWITIKYDPAGNEKWEQTFNQDSTSQDWDQEIPSAIAVTPAGNFYVTGNSASTIMTVKYGRDGDLVWVREYPGGGGLGMGSNAITTDAGGNVYVAGGSSSDYVLIEYDPAGNELWAVTYDSAGGMSDYATGVATWGTRLFLTGTAGAPLVGYRDYLTIRYR